MFIDASVIVAVAINESGAGQYIEQLERLRGRCLTSQLARFEAVLGVARARARSTGLKPNAQMIEAAANEVDAILRAVRASNVTISSQIGDDAIEASKLYGKAVGHPAQLNFGDCFAYACAKSLNVSLLYKGDDFAQTDLA